LVKHMEKQTSTPQAPMSTLWNMDENGDSLQASQPPLFVIDNNQQQQSASVRLDDVFEPVTSLSFGSSISLYRSIDIQSVMMSESLSLGGATQSAESTGFDVRFGESPTCLTDLADMKPASLWAETSGLQQPHPQHQEHLGASMDLSGSAKTLSSSHYGTSLSFNRVEAEEDRGRCLFDSESAAATSLAPVQRRLHWQHIGADPWTTVPFARFTQDSFAARTSLSNFHALCADLVGLLNCEVRSWIIPQPYSARRLEMTLDGGLVRRRLCCSETAPTKDMVLELRLFESSEDLLAEVAVGDSSALLTTTFVEVIRRSGDALLFHTLCSDTVLPCVQRHAFA
jgi:hypothetical protein